MSSKHRCLRNSLLHKITVFTFRCGTLHYSSEVSRLAPSKFTTTTKIYENYSDNYAGTYLLLLTVCYHEFFQKICRKNLKPARTSGRIVQPCSSMVSANMNQLNKYARDRAAPVRALHLCKVSLILVSGANCLFAQDATFLVSSASDIWTRNSVYCLLQMAHCQKQVGERCMEKAIPASEGC